LFNPLSIVKALEQSSISDFWLDTGNMLQQITLSELINNLGRNAPWMQNLWQASNKFHHDFDLPITQKSVVLKVDEHMNFKTCYLLNFCSSSSHLTNTARLKTISDDGLGVSYITQAISLCTSSGGSSWYVVMQ
jgi:hypothetical protein